MALNRFNETHSIRDRNASIIKEVKIKIRWRDKSEKDTMIKIYQNYTMKRGRKKIDFTDLIAFMRFN